MRLAIAFFGILYGKGGKTGCDRDFRHCWPNIERMVVQPYRDAGHDVKLFFSSYPFEDKAIEQEFYDMVKPDKIVFSQLAGSDAFTSKTALFQTFMNDSSVDTIIYTRADMHWNKKFIDTNINYDRFNFLFKERDWWQSHMYACDNLYIFPQHMSEATLRAMLDDHASPAKSIHKHELPRFLMRYINPDQINFMSKEHQYSDMNNFYTLCRNELRPECRGEFMHPDVAERFGYE
jgi:hypothetical protein